MYLDYLKNCKFTSPTTLPLINFMQRSLVELYSMDPTVTYQHGFVFLRQLAVHLRTAILQKKPVRFSTADWWLRESEREVHEDVSDLGKHSNRLQLAVRSCVEPLDECDRRFVRRQRKIDPTVGPSVDGADHRSDSVRLSDPSAFSSRWKRCDRLIPTSRYYPLRFHCVRLLVKLSELTPTFVPVLPFLLEMFDLTDFNKRHKTASLKAQFINFDTSLKLTKLQMEDRAFKVWRLSLVFSSITRRLGWIDGPILWIGHALSRSLRSPYDLSRTGLSVDFEMQKIHQNLQSSELREDHPRFAGKGARERQVSRRTTTKNGS